MVAQQECYFRIRESDVWCSCVNVNKKGHLLTQRCGILSILTRMASARTMDVNRVNPSSDDHTRRTRGFAVIISNKYFPLIRACNAAFPMRANNQDPTRHGADTDDSNLQYVFDTKLNFKMLDKKTYMNVNKYPYKLSRQTFWIHDEGTKPVTKSACPCLSCRIQSTDHSRSECFVLAISTHGTLEDREQVLCFSDDLYVDRVTLSEVIETLSDANCDTLVGKPRIIILQVCRSDPDVPKDKQESVWRDKGHIVQIQNTAEQLNSFPNLAIDDIANDYDANTETEDPDVPDTETVGTIKVENSIDQNYFYGTEKALRDLPSDFLIVFPTPSGRKAVHNFKDGSWFIDELKKVVENHDFTENPEMNFLKILTLTSERVARDKEDKKQQKNAPCIVHRLLKPLIFKDIERDADEQPEVVQDTPAM